MWKLFSRMIVVRALESLVTPSSRSGLRPRRACPGGALTGQLPNAARDSSSPPWGLSPRSE